MPTPSRRRSRTRPQQQKKRQLPATILPRPTRSLRRLLRLLPSRLRPSPPALPRMRRSDLHRIWPLGLMLTCATLAHGQATNAAKTAADAARRLELAKANREAEAERGAATSAASK